MASCVQHFIIILSSLSSSLIKVFNARQILSATWGIVKLKAVAWCILSWYDQRCYDHANPATCLAWLCWIQSAHMCVGVICCATPECSCFSGGISRSADDVLVIWTFFHATHQHHPRKKFFSSTVPVRHSWFCLSVTLHAPSSSWRRMIDVVSSNCRNRFMRHCWLQLVHSSWMSRLLQLVPLH